MNANEPAFPFHYKDRLPSTGEETTREQWCGMTKREYFAAAALKGFLAADAEGVLTPDNASVGAVRYADALLEELSKSQPKEQS